MTTRVQAHLSLVALALGDGAGGSRPPPTEFRIFPMGLVETAYGPFIFDDKSAVMVMEEYASQGNELFIDYDHKSLEDDGPVDGGKAAGWFALEVRADGLWAINVRWTPAASAALSAGEWRYFSPAFYCDEDRRICCLINIALTNNPATKNMEPLVAASARGARGKAQGIPMNKTILVALGLAETISEADAVGAAQALVTLGRDLRALTGKATDGEALATIKAWQESHEALGAARVELSALKAKDEAASVETLIKLGREQGKITAGNEAKVRALSGSAGIQAFLDTALPVLPANAASEPGETPSALGKSWEQLSAGEKHRLFNDDRVTYDALRKDYLRRNPGH